MQHSYYIDETTHKDGPHDLVTVMRRIRNGKINKSTYIYVDTAATPVPAVHIQEIAMFFDRTTEVSEKPLPQAPSTWKLIENGWRFTSMHSVMTVYAGALWLIVLMLASGLYNMLGMIVGSIATWCVFVLFQNLYLVFSLRLFRGQAFGADFFDNMLSPIMLSLISASCMLALMMAGGWFLLLVPGLIVAVLYVFVPFFMLDHKFRTIEAMHASRLLLTKYARSYVPVICLLILLYLACVILIVPIPLALPIFSAALSQLYEDLSAI